MSTPATDLDHSETLVGHPGDVKVNAFRLLRADLLIDLVVLLECGSRYVVDATDHRLSLRVALYSARAYANEEWATAQPSR